MPNRKQPFGYSIESGLVVTCPPEAEAVQRIFKMYLAGASFKEIAQKMAYSNIPYNESSLWNKNTVSRILADRRYSGDKGYTAIVAHETALAVENKRKAQVIIPPSPLQVEVRRLSTEKGLRVSSTKVEDLLNALKSSPDRIDHRESTLSEKSDLIAEKQSFLESELDKQAIDEDAIRSAVFSLAATKLEAVGSEDYESSQIIHNLNEAKNMDTPDHILLKRITMSIQQNDDGQVKIILKNGQELVI